jgi:hypothetical protein
MHDDEEITSDELDRLLDASETLGADRPGDGIGVRLYVTVDPDPMRSSSERPLPKSPTSAS